MNLERITILAATDGHNIPAYLFTPDSARGGAALIPPYGSTKEHMLGIAATLGEVGIAALSIDLCGHGENRTAIGPVMRDEVESAVRYMRRFGRAAAVGLVLVGRALEDLDQVGNVALCAHRWGHRPCQPASGGGFYPVNMTGTTGWWT